MKMKAEKETRAWHSVCLAETTLLPSADLDGYLLVSSMTGVPSRCRPEGLPPPRTPWVAFDKPQCLWPAAGGDGAAIYGLILGSAHFSDSFQI